MAQKDIESMIIDDNERRIYLRFPVVLPVDFGKADYFLSSICSNVSAKGLFIETSKEFSVGERVCLFVSLPNESDPVKLIGEVMWTTEGQNKDLNDNIVNGIGIRFINNEGETDQLLKGFLRSDKNERFYAVDESEFIL
jgi:uncharacterized protein (TIGR02266 family)